MTRSSKLQLNALSFFTAVLDVLFDSSCSPDFPFDDSRINHITLTVQDLMLMSVNADVSLCLITLKTTLTLVGLPLADISQ